MLDRLLRALLVVGGVSAVSAWTWPGAFPAADPLSVVVRHYMPDFHRAVWSPGTTSRLAWASCWPANSSSTPLASGFPPTGGRTGATSASRAGHFRLRPTAPAIVVGEVHHPVKLVESAAPDWLTIPERGLYTGVAIFGAVGSGKTSACMHPFARQLLSWKPDNPERRVAALVLEVKGDFCHDIRQMLVELGRGDDYIELSLDGRISDALVDAGDGSFEVACRGEIVADGDRFGDALGVRFVEAGGAKGGVDGDDRGASPSSSRKRRHGEKV